MPSRSHPTQEANPSAGEVDANGRRASISNAQKSFGIGDAGSTQQSRFWRAFGKNFCLIMTGIGEKPGF